MTIGSITNHKKKLYAVFTQLLCGLTAIAITAPIMIYAYGYNPSSIEKFFSFSALGLIVKVLLGIAMLILVFFARPHSPYLRAVLTMIAAIALVYTNYSIFTETLALGDGIVYFVASLIAMTESVEAEIPRRNQIPAQAIHYSPSLKEHRDLRASRTRQALS